MPGRMIQVSDDPYTFESVPGYRGWRLVGVGIIEAILGWNAWRIEQDSISTVEQVVVGLFVFIVTVVIYWYVRNRSDRVVVSTEGVCEFHRKTKSKGWILRNKTPCAEWAEARVGFYWNANAFATPLYLELVHETYKNKKRIVLSSSPEWRPVFGMDFEYLSQLASAAAGINEILDPRDRSLESPRTRESRRSCRFKAQDDTDRHLSTPRAVLPISLLPFSAAG